MAIQITEDVRARDGSPVKYSHCRKWRSAVILIVILFVGASSSTMIAFSGEIA